MSARFLVVALVASVSMAQTLRSYSDTKASPVKSVCVLPAEAHLIRVGMKGGESLMTESEDWAAKLSVGLQAAVKEAGGVIKGDLSREALNANEEERQIVINLRQKYESVSAQMRKKRADVKKGRFTLGDEIALLPCAAQADSVAFIDASGRLQTAGRKTFSIFTGGVVGILAAMSRYEVWICLADTKTGELSTLFKIDSFGGKTGTNPEEAFKKALLSQFKKLGASTTK